MRLKLLLLFLFFGFAASAQNMQVVNFEELQKQIKTNGDSLRIVNFWATWCAPCLEEMPYFVQAQESFKEKKISFSYVSLDFSRQLDKAEEAAKKMGLKGSWFLLKDNPNDFVNKIDPNWEGQIPITLIVLPNGDYITRLEPFHSLEEIKEFIKPHIN